MTTKNRVGMLSVSVFALLPGGTIAGASLAAEKIPDNVIVPNVEETLAHDARVEASYVHVSAPRGIVTLTGATSSIAAREYADLEAEKIAGVLGVINEIEVTPRNST